MTSLSIYGFYTNLPNNSIKDKRNELIERNFQREGYSYLGCNDRNAFFTSEQSRNKVGKVSTNFAAAKNGKVGSNFSAAKNGQVSSNSKKR